MKRPDAAPRNLIDVSKDNNLSPIDALLVINFLNGRSSGEGEVTSLMKNEFNQFDGDLLFIIAEDIVDARRKQRRLS